MTGIGGARNYLNVIYEEKGTGMRTYIIRRLILIIPTVFIASLIIFFVIRLIPGDVIDLMAAQQSYFSKMDRVALEHAMGLDVPVHIQYVRWIGNIILHGDLGDSLWDKSSVSEEVSRRIPVTLELGFLALVVSQIIALPIGIYSAIRQDTGGDYIARTFAILCISLPGFWIGTMVVVFPSIWWNWSPATILIPLVEDPLGNLQMFIIPAVIMGMLLSGVTMRMTRTMMLEVLRQDYIRTAWSKGLKERVIIIRHALKNALIPVITIVGLQMPVMIGGSVVMEQIFCLPGIGRLLVEATFERDYPVISGVMLFFAVGILIINLAVDLTYGYFDPRVQYN
jgi:peptide/nickel transport system permease protein